MHEEMVDQLGNRFNDMPSRKLIMIGQDSNAKTGITNHAPDEPLDSNLGSCGNSSSNLKGEN